MNIKLNPKKARLLIDQKGISVRVATEQDMEELGWVKAKPTWCENCIHCDHNTKSRARNVLTCTRTALCKDTTNPKWGMVCLSYKPKDSGKQVLSNSKKVECSEPAQNKLVCPECGWESNWEIYAGSKDELLCVKCLQIRKFKEVKEK